VLAFALEIATSHGHREHLVLETLQLNRDRQGVGNVLRPLANARETQRDG
jgi:hypothetical protein